MHQTAMTVSHARHHHHVRVSGVALLQGLKRGAVQLLLHLAAAQRERRERQQMAELCDATLRDLGLSRADIWAQLDRPRWRR